MNASRAEKPITIRQRQDPRMQASHASVAPERVETDVRTETRGGERGSGLSWSKGTDNGKPHANDTATDTYKVGYGKPPLATRFTSGNQPRRRGRKPKPKSTREAEIVLMNASYPHVEKGKPIILNGHQLMARARFQKALKGDLRAMAEIIRSTMPTPEELDEIANGRPLNEHENYIWNAMIEIARGTGGENDD